MTRDRFVAASISLALALHAQPVTAQMFPGAPLPAPGVWATLGVGPWGMAGPDWHASTWYARGPVALGLRIAGGTESVANRVRVATSAMVGYSPIIDRKTLVIALGAATELRTDVVNCSGCTTTDASQFLRNFAPSFATEFSFDVSHVGFGAALGAVGGDRGFVSLTLLLRIGASHPRAEFLRNR